MMGVMRRVFSVAVAVAVSSVAASSSAADICAETVPANRFIDGLPAYAQCAGSMNGDVYSNNGVETSTSSGGTGWVRTQRGGGYQCTELAHRYLYFRWNVNSVPSGNAGVWCDATLPAGLAKATTPVHGDLIVLAPGSCGADATTGHVAVVDAVNADGSMMAVQQNVASRSRYNLSCAACILHVAANDGTPPDGGAPVVDAGGAGGAVGATGAAGTSGGAGRVGTAGRSGAAGSSGAAGTTGGAGTVGVTGSAGTTGAAGTIGAAGTTGTAGVTGAAGGTAGVAGAAGTTGVAPDDLTGGCACHAGGSGEPAAPLGLILVVELLPRRRRRRAS